MNNPEQASKDCAAVAWVWLAKRYGLNGLVMPRFETSKRVKRGRYIWEKQLIKMPPIEKGTTTWNTYYRKKVGRIAYRILCNPLEEIMLLYVHEFTHAIQYQRALNTGDKPVLSEIETTQNELDFAKENLPHLYKFTTEV